MFLDIKKYFLTYQAPIKPYQIKIREDNMIISIQVLGEGHMGFRKILLMNSKEIYIETRAGSTIKLIVLDQQEEEKARILSNKLQFLLSKR